MIQFSIIIPLYNNEKYIEECVNSILQQDFCSFEIIIVDDGSTDTSYDICKLLKKRDSRIHLYHKDNGGVT